MRAAAHPSVGFLSAGLLLLCLFGAVAENVPAKLPAKGREMLKDGRVAAHQAHDDNYEPTEYGYGPPPYYTAPVTVSTESYYNNPPDEPTSIIESDVSGVTESTSQTSTSEIQTVESVESYSSTGPVGSEASTVESGTFFLSVGSSSTTSDSGSTVATAAAGNATRSHASSSLLSTISVTLSVLETTITTESISRSDLTTESSSVTNENGTFTSTSILHNSESSESATSQEVASSFSVTTESTTVTHFVTVSKFGTAHSGAGGETSSTSLEVSHVSSGLMLNRTVTSTLTQESPAYSLSSETASQWPSHPRSTATVTFHNLTATLPTIPSSWRSETSISTSTSSRLANFTFVSPMFSKESTSTSFTSALAGNSTELSASDSTTIATSVATITSEDWSTVTLITGSEASGLTSSELNATITLTSTLTAVPTSSEWMSNNSSASLIIITRTKSAVITSSLTEISTKFNSSMTYSVSNHLTSMNSSRVSRPATLNDTTSFGTATPVIVTVTRGSVVTIFPGRVTRTDTLTFPNVSTTFVNMSTTNSQTGSSTTRSDESISFTSNWSTITFNQPKTTSIFTNLSVSFNASGSVLPPLSPTLSPPFPANSTTTRTAETSGHSLSTRSGWSASETIPLSEATMRFPSGGTSSKDGYSTKFSIPLNATVTGPNGTVPMSTTTRAATSIIFNTTLNTASGLDTSAVTSTSVLTSLGLNVSITSIRISRGSTFPPFPFPTNSSSIWGTTVQTAAASARTATHLSSEYANRTMSGKGATTSHTSMSTSTITLWPSTVFVTVHPTKPKPTSLFWNSTTASRVTNNGSISTVSGSEIASLTLTRGAPWNTTRVWRSTDTIPSITLFSSSPPFPTSMNMTATSMVTAGRNSRNLTSTGSSSDTIPLPPIQSNSTMVSLISESGIPLPLPFTATGKSSISTDLATTSSSSLLYSESQTLGSSVSSTAEAPTKHSTSFSAAATPPFPTFSHLNTTTLPFGTGISWSRFTSTSTRTVVITRSAASTPQFPTGNSTTSSISPTGHGGDSVSTITVTMYDTSRVFESATSTSSGNVNSPIGINTTSEVSGSSDTSWTSGSATHPTSSALSDSAKSTTPTAAWTLTVSSITESISKVTSAPYQNSTTFKASSVSVQATNSGGAVSTSDATWNSTSSCLSGTNSVDVTSSCTSTQASTTCTNSDIDTGTVTSNSLSNCTVTQVGTISPWTFHPPIPIPATSVCNSSSTTSTCYTSRWAKATVQHTSQRLKGHTQSTTLETVTTSSPTSDVGDAIYPSVTDAAEKLPNNPNFPWGGGNSPIHRHGNTTKLGEGSEDEPPSFSPPQRRWEKLVSKLKDLWQNNGAVDEEEQG